ncbi:G3P acyltransferase [Kluyvera intermedia]|nr:G3P acyltransferase [Kluyvera intermedia]
MSAIEPGMILLAYLCGSISSAILVCRIAGLPDPRNCGSGNPGPLTYYVLAVKALP